MSPIVQTMLHHAYMFILKDNMIADHMHTQDQHPWLFMLCFTLLT